MYVIGPAVARRFAGRHTGIPSYFWFAGVVALAADRGNGARPEHHDVRPARLRHRPVRRKHRRVDGVRLRIGKRFLGDIRPFPAIRLDGEPAPVAIVP